ncbi:hypothetical protein COCNU_02G018640 [Cocos nucifera]|uniref:Secreted protein n=1 Tax=Cocos nucifera TaxID=13894 RepID=A0A8K0MXP8_COCNU|nr:hypothetical protein COCNU_02G018640 [Cocos nucifera]
MPTLLQGSPTPLLLVSLTLLLQLMLLRFNQLPCRPSPAAMMASGKDAVLPCAAASFLKSAVSKARMEITFNLSQLCFHDLLCAKLFIRCYSSL